MITMVKKPGKPKAKPESFRPVALLSHLGKVMEVIIGQLPRVSREDPERIRVDSVVETFVCSLFSVLCHQIF